ncbi:MAG: dephospho-CoA kinase [Candidatus Omnitrophica bacterium]|nr:dephospho-CoA kinase [Candidatus Omnitrophota bacterium]
MGSKLQATGYKLKNKKPETWSLEPEAYFMLIIGITGSLGTGKTTVSEMFRELGAEVIDADEISHNIIKIDSVREKVKKALDINSRQISCSNFRQQIAKIVFKDNKKIKELEKILHPLVIKEIKKRFAVSEKRILVLDAPLLLETGLNKIVDKVVVVIASLKEQVSRAQKKGFSRREILQRIDYQIALSEKIKQADFVVDNNKEIKKTKEQVKKIWRIICNE